EIEGFDHGVLDLPQADAQLAVPQRVCGVVGDVLVVVVIGPCGRCQAEPRDQRHHGDQLMTSPLESGHSKRCREQVQVPFAASTDTMSAATFTKNQVSPVATRNVTTPAPPTRKSRAMGTSTAPSMATVPPSSTMASRVLTSMASSPMPTPTQAAKSMSGVTPCPATPNTQSSKRPKRMGSRPASVNPAIIRILPFASSTTPLAGSRPGQMRVIRAKPSPVT